MSLCGPAVATGSTARPPGQQKSPPLIQESPKGEKRVDSLLIKKPILGILSAAPATNDRCSEDDETACYALLRELLIQDARQANNKGASQMPFDWQLIHGDEYEEHQESLAPGSTNANDNNDNYMGNYEDLEDYVFSHVVPSVHAVKLTSSLAGTRKTTEPKASHHNDDDNTPNHAKWIFCQEKKSLRQRVTRQINKGPTSTPKGENQQKMRPCSHQQQVKPQPRSCQRLIVAQSIKNQINVNLFAIYGACWHRHVKTPSQSTRVG